MICDCMQGQLRKQFILAPFPIFIAKVEQCSFITSMKDDNHISLLIINLFSVLDI